MSKPYSVKTEPWTSFDKQSYNIFSDDFVHQKLFTAKLNTKPSRGGLNLKQQIKRKDKKYSTQGQIKLWFPLWNTRSGQIYFKSKGDNFKVHYDNGLTQVLNKPINSYNIYGSYQSNKNFQNIVLKLGANILSKHWSFDNRIRVEKVDDFKNHSVSTGHKVTWARNQWSFDAYQIIQWKDISCLSNAVRVGFHQGDNEFFVRATNQNKRSIQHFDYKKPQSYFTSFIFDYIRKIDDLTKIGVQVEVTPKSFEKSSVVVQRSIPSREVGVKAKVSTNKSVALCYQAVLKNYGKWTAGVQVSDIGNTNKIQYGLQLDLNI